jgi:predicted SnoaL-like aldol condensation-catalyzing enzyme
MKRLATLLAAIMLAATAGDTAPAKDAVQMEANKKIVVDFYEKALNQKDFEAASKYFGAQYIQRIPTVPDGPRAFKELVELLHSKFPDSHSEIKRVFADGDYAVLHVHNVREPATRGSAIVDIFRLELVAPPSWRSRPEFLSRALSC